MAERKTGHIGPAKHTHTLNNGGSDLSLLATALILRGQQVLGERSPAALAKLERWAAVPAMRRFFGRVVLVLEAVALRIAIFQQRLSDLSLGLSQLFVSRMARIGDRLSAIVNRLLP